MASLTGSQEQVGGQGYSNLVARRILPAGSGSGDPSERTPEFGDRERDRLLRGGVHGWPSAENDIEDPAGFN